MITLIGDRLDIYGMPVCPLDGRLLEHVFTRTQGSFQLVCRMHPGHPFYEGSEPEHSTKPTPTPRLVSG